jgi:Cdc6-like AAA superfamily ATPase
MRDSLRLKLHGQHLVQETLVPALRNHFENNSPTKALALSFHGWVGIGKTFVSKLIVDYLFQKKSSSQFVHFIKCGYEFPSSGAADIEIYKVCLMEK